MTKPNSKIHKRCIGLDDRTLEVFKRLGAGNVSLGARAAVVAMLTLEKRVEQLEARIVAIPKFDESDVNGWHSDIEKWALQNKA